LNHLLNPDKSLPNDEHLRESWAGIDEQLLEVSLEPSTSLRGRTERIGHAAVSVVSHGRGVGGTVALATWLDPDVGVEESVGRDGVWADTETGSLGIAPVSPCGLTSWLLSRSGLVDDEVSGEASLGQKRSEVSNVGLFVARWVSLGVRWAGGDGPGVVVGNVGGETTDLGWRSSSLDDFGEISGSWSNVGCPSEPSGVSGIEVHGNVWQVESGNGILDAGFISSLSVCALCNVQVGDHVGQTIWLNDESNWDIWVQLDDGSHGVNVLALVSGNTTVGDDELSVRGQGGTITVWQIVNDKDGNDICTSGSLGADVIEV